MAKDTLSKEDARALRALLDALAQFTSIDPNMPVQQIRAFLFVALHEGSNRAELATRSGIHETVLSRYLRGLGEFDRYNDEGAKLVQQKINVRDQRQHQSYLTPEGVTKRHDIVRALAH